MAEQLRPDKERVGKSEPTLDGKRLQIQNLNLVDANGNTRTKRFLRRLSEFLAGMYTGESCAGTPHSERKQVGREDVSDRPAQNDRRL